MIIRRVLPDSRGSECGQLEADCHSRRHGLAATARGEISTRAGVLESDIRIMLKRIMLKQKVIMLRNIALSLAALLLVTPGAQAQGSWPAKPVKILVPTAPGGTADSTARLFAQHLSK